MFSVRFGMHIWGVALAFAFVCGAQAQAECRMDEVGEMPIKVATPRILVEAALNGRPAEMIVDTGSPFTVLSAPAAKRLGLRPHSSAGGVRMSGVGGDAVTQEASVQSLSFGRFSLKNDTVFVAGDLDHDGVVGRDAFSGYDIEVDIAHSAIRLLRPVGCSDAQMVYWGGSSYSEAPLEDQSSYIDDFRTQISLNGHSFPAILDTGAPGTVVTTGAAQIAGVTLASPGSTLEDQAGGFGPRRVPSFSGVFHTVGVGEEIVRNARISVADLWKYNVQSEIGTRLGAISDNPYGLIGDDFLRSHRVLISPSHHKIFFTYLGGAVFQPYPPPLKKSAAPAAM